jgi:hypothetical protein
VPDVAPTAAGWAKRERIHMARALAGGEGWVNVTPLLAADDLQRVDRLAGLCGLGRSAAVRRALDGLARHLAAGGACPEDRPIRGTPRRTLAEVRAGAAGWAMPSYSFQAPYARLLDVLARRLGRDYSATVRAALVVLERQLGEGGAA